MTRPDFDVVYVVSSFPPIIGGVELSTASLSRSLSERGRRVAVLTRHQPGLPRRERRDGYVIRRLGTGQTGKMGSLTFGAHALSWLFRARSRVRVVHAQNPDTPLLIGLIGRSIAGLRLVVTIHGERKIRRMSRTIPGRLRLGLARRLVDRFCALTSEVEGALREMGVPADRIVAIPNGIDTEELRPPTSSERRAARESLEIGMDESVAVFVGRLAASKRVDVLLKAWSQMPRGSGILLIVGGGREEEALRDIARDAGLSSRNVRFAGEATDVRPYLWASDVFVLPSEEEGLSLAMLEAMATGLCVVASDLPGHRRVIQDEVTGLRVPVADAPSLASALEGILASPERRRQMGAGARLWIQGNTSLDHTSSSHARMYAKLGSREGRSRAEVPAA